MIKDCDVACDVDYEVDCESGGVSGSASERGGERGVGGVTGGKRVAASGPGKGAARRHGGICTAFKLPRHRTPPHCAAHTTTLHRTYHTVRTSASTAALQTGSGSAQSW